MEKYINYEMCKECGGLCCQQSGCIYLPEDFKRLSFNFLQKQIDKGKISIAGQPFNGFLRDGWTFLLYLRARNVDSPIVDLISHGGPCVLWDKATGCKLRENDRPSGGKLLRPVQVGGPCENMGKQEQLFNWLLYNDVLKELVKFYTNKNVEEIMDEQVAQLLVKEESMQPFTDMEQKYLDWYYNVMENNEYYSPDEALKFMRIKKSSRR